MSPFGPWKLTLLSYPLQIGQPVYLLLLPVALAVLALAFFSALGRRRRLLRVVPDRLADRLAPGASVAYPAVKSMLSGLSLFFFGLALAQPQCGSHSELLKRRGIDVVVALDASKSMLARDVQPSRIERARLELSTLFDELKGDRVGLVVFAGDAFIQCPLTSDYEAAKMFLRAVDPEHMPQGGTNIGAALLLARQVFDNADRGAKEKVVVLVSDGEDLVGEVREGVEAMRAIGARVFAVGIGSEQGEPIPLVNKRGEVAGYKKDSAGNTVLTRLDRAGLTAIAEATSGEFFYEPRGVAMGKVVEIIDKLQKDELESRLTVRYAEYFQYLLWPGVVLFALALFMPASWNRPAEGKP